MQARVSRGVDVLGLPAAVCCGWGRDGAPAWVCRSLAGFAFAFVPVLPFFCSWCSPGLGREISRRFSRLFLWQPQNTTGWIFTKTQRNNSEPKWQVSEVPRLLHHLTVPWLISCFLPLWPLYWIGKSGTDSLVSFALSSFCIMSECNTTQAACDEL